MNYGIINAKLTTGEMDELMQRRARGDKLAHDAMYHQAWLLMHFFASQVNAEEHTYTYYKRIDDVLDKFDAKKGKLSNWIKRSFLGHADYMRNKPLNKCLSLEYDEIGKSLKDKLFEEPVSSYGEDQRALMWRGLLAIDADDARLLVDRHMRGLTLKEMRDKWKFKCHQTASYRLGKAMASLREAMASLEDVD